jgi:hypothetical protein
MNHIRTRVTTVILTLVPLVVAVATAAPRISL